MDEMDLSQFREVFVSEAKEHLVSLNAALVELEKKPSNKDVLSDIFRVAHTLKGMSATMGYEKVTNLTHVMEDVLDKLRKSEVQAKGNVVDVIFECFDKLESLITEIETGVESKIDIDGIVHRLQDLIEGKEEKKSPGQKTKEPEAPAVKEARDQEDAAQQAGQQPAEQEAAAGTKKAKTSIRINISHLDTMMNLVGEMVISKSQLEQIAAENQIVALKQTLQQLDRIAVDLQEAVLKTRMVPLSQIFDRYPRMMRDLALKLGKEVDFEIFGADIEIDRMLMEEINEPLVHLLRNAVDHGIEAPDVRAAVGKERKAHIELSARRERGYIAIQVKDDGKGMDPQVVKEKAVQKGIVSEEDAKTMPDDEIFLLICDPRFSTAETITDISGRGVGMDVVKTSLESFNGRLSIDSISGKGSTFTVNLPLSIAIISALLVRVQDETYAIPLNNITEVVPFLRQNLKSIEKKEVIILRNEVLPLIWLEKALGVTKEKDYTEKDNKYVLRVESGNKAVGLVADNFIGRKEIVIKSLSGIMKRARGLSGATILGDGSVVLILDVNNIV
ncbi:MAG: chemotaxis protein CheA [Endomicrobiales bacterium]|nr:chemotaxis protein CheA [Endomicrobiales bacterium]